MHVYNKGIEWEFSLQSIHIGIISLNFVEINKVGTSLKSGER